MADKTPSTFALAGAVLGASTLCATLLLAGLAWKGAKPEDGGVWEEAKRLGRVALDGDFAARKQLAKITKLQRTALKTVEDAKRLAVQLGKEMEEEEQEKTKRALAEAQVGQQRSQAEDSEKEESGNSSGLSGSSYYFFSSQGEKLKNKWDSYDVDAELAKLDKPGPPTGKRSRESRVNGIEKRFEVALVELDAIAPVTLQVRNARKRLVTEINQQGLSIIDDIRERYKLEQSRF